MGEIVELYEDIYDKNFSFGKNWKAYLKTLNSKKVDIAKQSLMDFLKINNLNNKTFIDFGCGSGLFSLSAIKLGAKKVISIDIDENSLNCARYLRKKFKISNDIWIIKKGSALDGDFIKSLGKFDIVYSWGVLHHTGNMKKALKNIIFLMKKNSLLYIALYNDFKGLPFNSSTWVKIKKFYSSSNIIIRKIMEINYFIIIFTGLILHRRNPYKYIKNYSHNSLRGMNFYYDLVDWLGGYPFEFISVKNLKQFYSKYNLELINLNKNLGEGCSEYLFKLK